MKRLPSRLVALTPGTLEPAHVERFLHSASRAIAAGLDSVLVREPGLSDRAVLELALALRARLDARETPGLDAREKAWLGLHDRAHLAHAARADGVHLGFRSLPPSEARRVVGAEVALGFSAHAGDELEPWAASDYLVLGPVFDTSSKRGWKEPLGLAGFARELARAPVPVWALGGIRAQNAREVLALGARGVAVRGALLEAADPEAAARALLDATAR